MYWVYVLRDQETGLHYVGSTGDFDRRLQEHSYWKPTYTLIHKEQFDTKEAAYHREMYFKSGNGRRSLKNFI
jgi:predicted GIY-YIG superfamily endonuclease